MTRPKAEVPWIMEATAKVILPELDKDQTQIPHTHIFYVRAEFTGQRKRDRKARLTVNTWLKTVREWNHALSLMDEAKGVPSES